MSQFYRYLLDAHVFGMPLSEQDLLSRIERLNTDGAAVRRWHSRQWHMATRMGSPRTVTWSCPQLHAASAVRHVDYLSDARREIGEAAAATRKLAFLVAAGVIAALGNELARPVELFARFREPRVLGRVWQSRRRGARLDQAVERREGFASAPGAGRARDRDVAKKETHGRPLSDLVELRPPPRAAPSGSADGAAERGACEQAGRNVMLSPESMQAFHGLIELGAGGARGKSVCTPNSAGRAARRALQRQGQVGAAED